MARFPTPFDFFRPTYTAGLMLMEAQMVIALRMLGLAGILPAAPGENMRMVTEKAQAAQEAGFAMARAIGAGADPGRIALAGLKPVRRRTRANAKRLSKAAGGGGS